MANQGVMTTPIFDELVAELNQTFADADLAARDGEAAEQAEESAGD